MTCLGVWTNRMSCDHHCPVSPLVPCAEAVRHAWFGAGYTVSVGDQRLLIAVVADRRVRAGDAVAALFGPPCDGFVYRDVHA
jgi:hypothetical protein